jgi:thioredoxin-like negative regulator of GroEL
MNADDLLRRMAHTLKREIGPAITDEYPKTQAFMAGVVLEKLARQIELAPLHAAAESADIAALLSALGELLAPAEVPAALSVALVTLARSRDQAALSGLVGALYETRTALGAERFERALGRVRETLRAGIDRQLAYAA